ncbi:ATP-binding cassette domain-containing protein [Azospirillum cavernae]|uniref:ATP-binding cassette domain-containing protein n=1 Tax=Azospirillum cavernae TaxID=2320860 RepID=A0A418VQD7_9PROT|nr:ATP-binding cassette domain-containing protein [Azospirillum cavernae]RJF78429.1 ATP-binding cassette domain-containing protein [Azospirillum cavernae]
MIEIEGVGLSHHGTTILHDVALTLPKGELIALIGPNGAGKSSLLSLVARLQPLQRGRIAVDGLPVDRTPGRDLARVLTVMRQDTGFAGRLSVRELVGFGRFPHGRGRLTDGDRALIDEALALFDLTALADRDLMTLSGGQRQRAFVAMAFCQGTDYLLLDEPLNNLDMMYARQMMRLLREMVEQRGRTVVIVLHDINYAAAYADRIVALKDGRIVAHGSPDDILTVDLLERLYGYRMQVHRIDGQLLVRHHD